MNIFDMCLVFFNARRKKHFRAIIFQFDEFKGKQGGRALLQDFLEARSRRFYKIKSNSLIIH